MKHFVGDASEQQATEVREAPGAKDDHAGVLGVGNLGDLLGGVSLDATSQLSAGADSRILERGNCLVQEPRCFLGGLKIERTGSTGCSLPNMHHDDLGRHFDASSLATSAALDEDSDPSTPSTILSNIASSLSCASSLNAHEVAAPRAQGPCRQGPDGPHGGGRRPRNGSAGSSTTAEAGLRDRSTRPHRIPRRVPTRIVRAIERLRLKERLGPHRIGWALGLAASTVYAVLRRLGISRLGRLEPRPEVIRYEWPVPGDLLHLDTKKLGRFSGVGKRFGGPKRSRRSGWDLVHVAIDDHSRLAYAEQLADEHGETAAAFLERALAFFETNGHEPSLRAQSGPPARRRLGP